MKIRFRDSKILISKIIGYSMRQGINMCKEINSIDNNISKKSELRLLRFKKAIDLLSYIINDRMVEK